MSHFQTRIHIIVCTIAPVPTHHTFHHLLLFVSNTCPPYPLKSIGSFTLQLIDSGCLAPLFDVANESEKGMQAAPYMPNLPIRITLKFAPGLPNCMSVQPVIHLTLQFQCVKFH
ncbi:hypothetical protein NE237_025021 [Protea cynaroides]|uniref:Uncharacterized protein n=1 Tax=Protea cynaroides TaxID=273540 RepID=A0A9Q0H4F6_9MAGN|nr:hypothetical protein NE237_025021 [Protea cynaroides]